MPRHNALKLANPFCIFCAGERPTTSVEHMPSRVLFEMKQRQRGLEFSSCQHCQNSTRREEQAIAMFSRVYPDAKTDAGRKEFRKILREAFRSFPGLVQEMQVDQLQVLRDLGEAAHQLPTWNFVGVGPITHGIIEKFAKKLAVALHFEKTKQIVPRGAGIYYTHFSNLEAIVDGMPSEFMNALGAEQVLAMGKSHSGGTFSYQSLALADQPSTFHMAYFRESFALLMAVFPDFRHVPPEMISEISVH